MNALAVANLGLGWLGAERVTSFDDPAKAARLLREQFAGIRDAVLEDRDWTFATNRRSVDLDPSAPLPPYQAKYRVPSDVIRLITVVPSGAAGTIDAFARSTYPDALDASFHWVREGDYIVAEDKAPSVIVKAIVRVEDDTRWSPGYCQALAARIAADLCIPLSNDRSLQADLWKLYVQKLRDAAANDGRQGRSERRTATVLSLRRR